MRVALLSLFVLTALTTSCSESTNKGGTSEWDEDSSDTDPSDPEGNGGDDTADTGPSIKDSGEPEVGDTGTEDTGDGDSGAGGDPEVTDADGDGFDSLASGVEVFVVFESVLVLSEEEAWEDVTFFFFSRTETKEFNEKSVPATPRNLLSFENTGFW